MEVWKFRVWKRGLGDLQTVQMPELSKIVHVAMQGEWLCLWALVEPTSANVTRHFAIRGTGHEIRDGLEYIGTAHDEPFVWHLFKPERTPDGRTDQKQTAF